MEIEIDSKKNNPLLNRTEVYFTVKHPGEGTPNRELIRSELADKLNAKKENIIVHVITPGFGTQETTGYAKVYSSVEKSKKSEREHILKRNKLIGEKKEEKTQGKPAAGVSSEQPSAKSSGEEEKPDKTSSVEPVGEQQPAEQPVVEEPSAETPSEEPVDEDKLAEPEVKKISEEPPVEQEPTPAETEKKVEESVKEEKTGSSEEPVKEKSSEGESSKNEEKPKEEKTSGSNDEKK